MIQLKTTAFMPLNAIIRGKCLGGLQHSWCAGQARDGGVFADTLDDR
jgi:hypothetical protein